MSFVDEFSAIFKGTPTQGELKQKADDKAQKEKETRDKLFHYINKLAEENPDKLETEFLKQATIFFAEENLLREDRLMTERENNRLLHLLINRFII